MLRVALLKETRPQWWMVLMRGPWEKCHELVSLVESPGIVFAWRRNRLAPNKPLGWFGANDGIVQRATSSAATSVFSPDGLSFVSSFSNIREFRICAVHSSITSRRIQR